MKPRVVIAGGSGFLGRALAGGLRERGYEVVILCACPQAEAMCNGTAHAGRLGEAARRRGGDYQPRREERELPLHGTVLAEIDESRENSVRVIGEAIARCAQPPRVWVQASTTAIYGDAGERWCDESTSPGGGVPVVTATRWERAFNTTPSPNTCRVVLRISFVLGRDGGVLRTLARLARFFLGGSVGSGRQYISWIHLSDLVRMFIRAIEDESIEGLYTATSPQPVTNASFMRSLRRAVHRPWSPPTPAWAVHIGSFFMRTEAVLALTGRRVTPKCWLDAGFVFEHTNLDAALDDLLCPSPGIPAEVG